MQLKNGENTNPDFIKNDGFLFKINERYWTYIIVHLLKDGYIEGVNVTKVFGNEVIISDIENCQITPKGIDYLCNNSLFEKTKCFLKEIKDIFNNRYNDILYYTDNSPINHALVIQDLQTFLRNNINTLTF